MNNSDFLDSVGDVFGVYEDSDIVELETWTSGGVNMHVMLDKGGDSYIKQLKDYIGDFDISEEIDVHRQDKLYKEHFEIKDSLVDFENYLDTLKGLVEDIENGK